MEDKKNFWIWSGLMVAAAAVSLVGAIIGKTIIGYVLFGLGLAGVVALFVLTFLKKDYFKENRLKPLILGVVIGLLLASSILLIVSGVTTVVTSSSSSRSSQNRMMGGMGGSSLSGLVSSGSTSSGTTTKRMKILVGSLLLAGGLGTAIIILIKILKKKLVYSVDQWKVLALGFVISAIIGVAIPEMVTSTAVTAGKTSQTAGQTASDVMGTPPAGFGPGETQAADTATATETATVEATEVATTEEPTETATSVSLSTLVVCLDPDVRVGLVIRNTPSESGRAVGVIPAAGCFTLDARAAGADGWYRMAEGQNNMGGITIYSDDSSLWVYAVNTDASADNLAGLTEIEAATATPVATTAVPTAAATAAPTATTTATAASTTAVPTAAVKATVTP